MEKCEDEIAVGDETLVIHVCDENRMINRDFKVNKTLLLSHMKYFTTYLSGSDAFDDIDISVHCDVHIFDWLVKYVHSQSKRPALDTTSVISILISSDFLGMDLLVEECLLFVRNHINDILRMPIDLNCLQPHLVSRLAAIFDEGHLEEIEDESDKIAGKIFSYKFDMLLNEKRDEMRRCAHCRCIFMAGDLNMMTCERARPTIDFRGNIVQCHVSDSTWSLDDHVLSFKSKKFTPEQRYWKLWGITHSFWCVNCHQKFLAVDAKKCFSHPIPPQYRSGQNTGRYPCCGQPARQFNSMRSSSGCIANSHSLPSSKKGGLELYDDPLWNQLLVNHMEDFLLSENVDSRAMDSSQISKKSRGPSTRSQSDIPEDRKLRDRRKKKTESDPSLSNSSSSTNRGAKAHRRPSVYRAHRHDKEQVRKSSQPESESDDSSSEGSQKIEEDWHVRTRKATNVSESEPLSPRRRRMWRQDLLREEDDFRMQNIVMDLRSQRHANVASFTIESGRSRETK